MTARYTNAMYGFAYLVAGVFVLIPSLLSLHRGSLTFSYLLISIAITAAELYVLFRIAKLLQQAHAPFFISQFVALLVTALVLTIYSIQGCALLVSNNYITLMAIQNTGEKVEAGSLVIFAIVSIAVFAPLAFVAIRSSGNRSAIVGRLGRQAIALALAFVALLGVGVVSRSESPTQINVFSPPATSLLLNLFWASKTYQALLSSKLFSQISTADMSLVFVKDYIYKSRIPKHFDIRQSHYNVVIVFMEGTSAKLMGAYGGTRPDLTPNMDAFAKKAIVIDHYYNHTAATFRGVHGQLTSSYSEMEYGEAHAATATHAGMSKEGGSWLDPSQLRIKFQSLPRILSNNAYDSYFIEPETEDAPFYDMLGSLGFSHVYGKEGATNDLLNGQAQYFYIYLDDHSIIDAAIAKFKSLENSPRPFLLSWYNIGTHAFLDVGAHAARYGDGKNTALNRLYNYDKELGRFFDYFWSSPAKDNTILIVTTDHASFPEPSRVEACQKEGCSAYFIDTVPLLIYVPGAAPQRFDADGRTSVDLTPTVLHMLGIQNVRNSFVGRSIFDTERLAKFGVAAISNDFYLTNGQDVYHTPPKDDEKGFAQMVDMIKAYYAAEHSNKVFSGD